MGGVLMWAGMVGLPIVATLLYWAIPKEKFIYPHVPDKVLKGYVIFTWVPGTLFAFMLFVAAFITGDGIVPFMSKVVTTLLVASEAGPVLLFALNYHLKPDGSTTTPNVDAKAALLAALTVPDALRPKITEVVMKVDKPIPNPEACARSINYLAELLPHPALITTSGYRYWQNYFDEEAKALAESTKKQDLEKGTILWGHYNALPFSLVFNLLQIPISVKIPEALRTQHMMVVAGSGAGKSQLFQSLILDDLKGTDAIIVIDSQNDLINKLATRVDQDRLILIDAEAAPPALNIFKLNNPGLLEYVFGALEAQMTSQQGMVYRYLCRHVMQIDGTVADLLRVLQNPEQPYKPTNEAAAAFFAEYAKPKGQYREVREQISRRLLTLLENDTFERMLTAPNLSVDIPDAIEKGKIVLINTAKANVGNAGATLFGRFWLALVLSKVMQGSRTPVRLYVDEFADYASDELETIFTQSRKYNLAMACAFQSLAQLPERLKAVMLTNTAIKLASSVSAEDRSNLARQMDTDPSFIAEARRGMFAAWFRDIGTAYYSVEFGRLEQEGELASLRSVHARMRQLYGPKSRPDEPPSPLGVSPKNPDNGPPGRAGKRSFNVEDQE